MKSNQQVEGPIGNDSISCEKQIHTEQFDYCYSHITVFNVHACQISNTSRMYIHSPRVSRLATTQSEPHIRLVVIDSPGQL